MTEYVLSPDGRQYEARFKVENTTPAMRYLYRNLRRSGLTPDQATLVVWGFVLCARDVGAAALLGRRAPRAFIHENRRQA